MRRTLSVRLSVCLSVCLSVRLSVRPSRYRYRASRRATSRITMTHMYFSARAEGRISYGHLGRTDSCSMCVLYLCTLQHSFNVQF